VAPPREEEEGGAGGAGRNDYSFEFETSEGRVVGEPPADPEVAFPPP